MKNDKCGGKCYIQMQVGTDFMYNKQTLIISNKTNSGKLKNNNQVTNNEQTI